MLSHQRERKQGKKTPVCVSDLIFDEELHSREHLAVLVVGVEHLDLSPREDEVDGILVRHAAEEEEKGSRGERKKKRDAGLRHGGRRFVKGTGRRF